jgi:hypothetical protein
MVGIEITDLPPLLTSMMTKDDRPLVTEVVAKIHVLHHLLVEVGHKLLEVDHNLLRVAFKVDIITTLMSQAVMVMEVERRKRRIRSK